MKNIIRIITIIILPNFFYSCNGSDGTVELSGNYFLRNEGKYVNDILSHGKSSLEIQANVLKYNYNDNFIIAEQKPNKTDDPLYEKTYNYKEGRNKIYYWIIVVKKDSLLGPLNKSEFDQERTKHNVPNDLILKIID